MTTFGENLLALRKARGLSQEELGRRLGHKRPAVVQSWEKNRRRPRPKAIERIAKELNCSPKTLLKGVPSDYDTLRGGADDDEGVTVPHPLTPTEKSAVDLMRQMNEKGLLRVPEVLSWLQRSYPREEAPAQIEKPRHTPPAITNKVPGKRRAEG